MAAWLTQSSDGQRGRLPRLLDIADGVVVIDGVVALGERIGPTDTGYEGCPANDGRQDGPEHDSQRVPGRVRRRPLW